MPTVLELADHAGVSVETVLRVLLREPTSEAARTRVEEAVAALGLPDYPRPDGHVEVLPAAGREGDALAPVEDGDAPADGLQLARELRDLFGELLERLERERRERIDDLALTTDLYTEGWRNVDRRLGRLEKIVERIDRLGYFERTRPADGAEIHRLDEHRRAGPD